MKRHLLLLGASGIGKTTLLLEELAGVSGHCAGFITQRLVKNEQTCGFCLTPMAVNLSPKVQYTSEKSGIFIEKTENGWRNNEKVFFSEGLACLIGAEDKKFVVLDEIGGIELTSPAFYLRLKELFLSETSCIGVLKSRENLDAMSAELGLNSECKRISSEFQSFLLDMTETDFLPVTRDNIVEARKHIRAFITERINSNKQGEM